MARHLENYRTYCNSTQRYEVFAYCGYSEEASGSGKTTFSDQSWAQDCDECVAGFNKEMQEESGS